MIRDAGRLLGQLRGLHARIQAAVISATEAQAVEALSAVTTSEDDEGDDIFAIDRVSEAELIDFFTREVAPERPLILIAEGLHDSGHGPGVAVLPAGTRPGDAEVRVIVDPIDGTRGLMYQKRSAWILTGVAPNNGPETRLADIEIALQTEIPLVKQHLADQLWATRGGGMRAERLNRLTGERAPLTLHPSRATTVAQGFAMISRFFPGGRDVLAAIDDEVIRAALGPVRPGKAQAYEDQYISTGGQLYELIAGHDRFVADLRPLLDPILARSGERLGICAHPYDLATVLLAREAGAILTDATGAPFDAPMDVSADVAWVGYANEHIRAQIEGPLQAALRSRGLL